MAYLFPPDLFETLEFIVFLILIAYTTGSAYLAVSVKSIYHSVLWLIFMILGVAMIFLLYAESALLLVVQMIVYAGGITVLMLFAVSLSGKDAMYEKPKDIKLLDWRLSFAGVFILFMIALYLIGQVANAFWQPHFAKELSERQLVENMVVQLFTTQGPTIIILGLLLLSAMLGSVYLVKKEVEQR
ncbi:MAG: NADH-quinone oxidoreductase subunit J family protein [Candidatus Hodarchaeales archaeon]